MVVGTHGVRVDASMTWMVWAMVAAVGVMAATFSPAKLSLVPNVVAPHMLTRANAAVVSTGIIGNLCGFFIGGPLVERAVTEGGTLWPVIVLAALCYGVSGMFWIFIRVRSAEDDAVRHGAIWHGFSQGVSYVRTHRVVLGLVGAAALVWATTSVVQPAVGVLAQSHERFALTMGCLGIGMLVASLWVGAVNARSGTEWWVSTGLCGCGVFTALLMTVPDGAPRFAAGLALGACGGMLLAPLNTQIQRITPDRLRGRVFAVKEMIGELAKVLVACAIWQWPGADPWMQPLSWVLALVLFATGLWAWRQHVATGTMGSSALNVLFRLNRLYVEGLHRLRISGRHRQPTEGPLLVISNHVSGVDPALIQAAIGRRIRWMMAAEYFVPALSELWRLTEPIPVHRDRADPTAARTAVRWLRAGGAIGLFPAGGIHADDAELQAGVVTLARGGRATILPVRVMDAPKTSHPFLALIRPSRSQVWIGKPFTLSPDEDRQVALHRIHAALDAVAADAPVR